MGLFRCVFIQKICIRHLLCARFCYYCWGETSGNYILMKEVERGGQIKVKCLSWLLVSMKGEKKGDCSVPFRVGKKSRSLKRDKVYRYLAKSIPN